jgi:hypothetical protein
MLINGDGEYFIYSLRFAVWISGVRQFGFGLSHTKSTHKFGKGRVDI